MCLAGALPWVRGALLFLPQMLGGMVAAGLVKCMFPGPMAVATTLGGGTSKAQGVFIEMFCTALLVFTVLMLAAEKWKATFIAPVGIGLALFVAELTGLLYLSEPPGFISQRLTFCSSSRLLHRRLAEPYALIRTLRRQPQFPRISLDILAWTSVGGCSGSRVLSIRKSSRLRGSKPGTGQELSVIRGRQESLRSTVEASMRSEDGLELRVTDLGNLIFSLRRQRRQGEMLDSIYYKLGLEAKHTEDG